MARPNDSTEYILHLVSSFVGSVKDRAIEESARDDISEIHYHKTTRFECSVAGCAGVDPISGLIDLLNRELLAIYKEYPTNQLNAPHVTEGG